VVFETSLVECEAQGWTDADGDSPLFLLEWLRNGETLDAPAQVDGEFFNKGDLLGCTLTPLDAYGEGIPQSAERVVQNSLPLADAVVIRPDRVDVASALRVEIDGERDDDQDAVSWSHAWFVNGVLESSVPILSGSILRRGDTVYAVSTPHDGESAGEEIQSLEYEVQNALPVISSVTIYPGEPSLSDLLSAIVSTSDADGDPVDVSYSWTINGQVVGTDATLSSGFVAGDSIQVSVRPSDSWDVGDWEDSDPVIVQSN